jgi:hypothetical protein
MIVGAALVCDPRSGNILPIDGPANAPRHRPWTFEIERLFRPTLEPRKAPRPDIRRHAPDVGQFPVNKTSKELSQDDDWTGPQIELTFTPQPEACEVIIDFCFGANPRVERCQQAGLFQQSPQLVANLGPLLARFPVAPFVEQASSSRKNSMRLSEDGPPVCGQIKEPRDDDGVEGTIEKWKLRPFRHHGKHRAVAGLGAKFGQHAGSRLESDDAVPARGKRDRDSSVPAPTSRMCAVGCRPAAWHRRSSSWLGMAAPWRRS